MSTLDRRVLHNTTSDAWLQPRQSKFPSADTLVTLLATRFKVITPHNPGDVPHPLNLRCSEQTTVFSFQSFCPLLGRPVLASQWTFVR